MRDKKEKGKAKRVSGHLRANSLFDATGRLPEADVYGMSTLNRGSVPRTLAREVNKKEKEVMDLRFFLRPIMKVPSTRRSGEREISADLQEGKAGLKT